MLVLTRKLGETICINDDICIVIQSIKKNQVRIGITAPRDTIVHREEIYQKIQKENKAAALSNSEMQALNDMYRSVQERSGEA